jgi:serine/threonine-protein kinase
VKSRIGRYRLVSKLGQGGMAQVWLAEQTGLEGFHKKVVVKRLRSNYAADTGLNAMFFTEAVVAGQLNHPNLVHVYDFSEADGERFIVMEYVDGPSLKRLLTLSSGRRMSLPIAAALKIASLICEGLQYAHTRRDERTGEPLRLVHRDITPDNILFARSGGVKVADFGIAKAATQRHETRPGELKGKLLYIAPEQLLSKPIDARADVFSVGVVLYEMLAGASPFWRENDAEVIEAIVHHEVPQLNGHRPEAPPALDAIIRKATAKNRDERWATAAELQEAIDRQLARVNPLFGSAQLRELIEGLDPASGGGLEEETVTEAAPLLGALEPDRMPTSVEIPFTAVQPVPAQVRPPDPQPRRSLGLALLFTALAAAVGSGLAAYLVAGRAPSREASAADSAVAPPPQRPREEPAAPETPRGEEPKREEQPSPAPVARAPTPAEVSPAEPPPAEPPPKPAPAASVDEGSADRARVSLQSEPDANVFIDGRAVGRTPLALALKFGAHKARFEDAALGLNKTVKLEVPEGPEYTKAFVFERARLIVEAPDGAEIYLGKRKVGEVPKPVQLYEGTQTVRVVHEPTRLDVTKTLELKPGDRFEPFATE